MIEWFKAKLSNSGRQPFHHPQQPGHIFDSEEAAIQASRGARCYAISKTSIIHPYLSTPDCDISESEPFTFRLRLTDGYRILPHVHPAYERVTVLQGTLHFAHGEEFDKEQTRALPVGSVAIMPPGDPMFGYAEGETIIQLHGSGPWGIEYINPGDDPRNR